jgi:uncharacterized DUF497 family protein
MEGCAVRTPAEIVNRVRARVCSVRSTNTVTGTIHDSVDAGKPPCDPRRRRRGRVDRQVQVTKDLLDDGAILNRRQEPQPAAAVRAGEDINRERALQQFGPRIVPWPLIPGRRRAAKRSGTGAPAFRDPRAVSIPDEEHSEEEDRWVTLGLDAGANLLILVHTFEDVDAARSRIGLISARKATKKESAQYGKANQ